MHPLAGRRVLLLLLWGRTELLRLAGLSPHHRLLGLSTLHAHHRLLKLLPGRL